MTTAAQASRADSAPRKPRNPQKPSRTTADQRRRTAATPAAETHGTAAQIRRSEGAPGATSTRSVFCGSSHDFCGTYPTTRKTAGHSTHSQVSADSAVSAATRSARLDEELLTVPQVMAALQVGRSTVYDLIRSRRLPSLTIGRARRIPASSLHDFIRHQLMEVA